MSYERLTADNTAVLFIDHQTGLADGVVDQSQAEFTSNVVVLAKLAKLFELPAVITTSAADGPNGPVMPQIKQLLPDESVIHRPGEINAWTNPEFVAAVTGTGRKKLIIAGFSTEVCVAFVAVSAVHAGYDAYAVIDACGTWSKLVQEVAIARVATAGVKPTTWVAVSAELQGDWRECTGQGLDRIMGEHLNFYSNLIGSYMTTRGAAPAV